MVNSAPQFIHLFIHSLLLSKPFILVRPETGQKSILRTLHAMWKNSHQMGLKPITEHQMHTLSYTHSHLGAS